MKISTLVTRGHCLLRTAAWRVAGSTRPPRQLRPAVEAAPSPCCSEVPAGKACGSHPNSPERVADRCALTRPAKPRAAKTNSSLRSPNLPSVLMATLHCPSFGHIACHCPPNLRVFAFKARSAGGLGSAFSGNSEWCALKSPLPSPTPTAFQDFETCPPVPGELGGLEVEAFWRGRLSGRADSGLGAVGGHQIRVSVG